MSAYSFKNNMVDGVSVDKTPVVKDQYHELIMVVQQLSLAKNIETIIEIVKKSARGLSGADGATFVLRDNDMCHYVDEDAISPLWKGKRFPISACVSGWAMLHKESVVIDDITKDARIPMDAYRPTFVKSLVMTPIRASSPIGAIGVYWAKEYRPSDVQVELLRALADSTSIAIENVKLYNDIKFQLEEKSLHEAKYRLLSEKLQGSLQEKELLLKEIYHRVKNNLQVVTSLLNLHAESTDQISVKDDLLKSITRINSMALVHEMLYRNDDLSAIKMPDYINQLIKFLHEVTETNVHHIKLTLDIDDISLGIDQAVPCGIIINELMMNVIKHAFPDNREGNLIVSMKIVGNKIFIRVQDDGVGMSKTKVVADQKSLGLDIIKTLTGQIDGYVTIDGGNGTVVEVQFPLIPMSGSHE